MKTNLDKFFKNDQALETGGVWLDITPTTGFLVRRFGGKNDTKVAEAMAKHYKPYAKQLSLNVLPAEKDAELSTRAFVEACLVDWKGVEIDGKEVPFEQELAVKFLLELPELSATLQKYSLDTKNYREELGNS